MCDHNSVTLLFDCKKKKNTHTGKVKVAPADEMGKAGKPPATMGNTINALIKPKKIMQRSEEEATAWTDPLHCCSRHLQFR